MSTWEHLINLMLAIVLIVGGYQFYFFPQKRTIFRSREFFNKIDERIPFYPSLIWVYSGLYYPIIIVLVLTIDNFRTFNYTAFNFIILLTVHLLFFFLFPVQVPNSWRDVEIDNSLSVRFLRFVHSYDGRSNCFPSMHVSVATLTSLHLIRNLQDSYGDIVILFYLFPVLIAFSCVFTKQHYIIDIPAGALLGYGSYALWISIV